VVSEKQKEEKNAEERWPEQLFVILLHVLCLVFSHTAVLKKRVYDYVTVVNVGQGSAQAVQEKNTSFPPLKIRFRGVLVQGIQQLQKLLRGHLVFVNMR